MNEADNLLLGASRALDALLKDKPMLAAFNYGTTTLGNLRVELRSHLGRQGVVEVPPGCRIQSMLVRPAYNDKAEPTRVIGGAIDIMHESGEDTLFTIRQINDTIEVTASGYCRLAGMVLDSKLLVSPQSIGTVTLFRPRYEPGEKI